MAKKKSSLYHIKHWPLHLGIGLLRLVALLPYRFKIQLGKIIGISLYYFNAPMRKLAEKNIQLCFPNLSDKERTELLKRNFLVLGVSFAEVLCLCWPKKNELNFLLANIEGQEYLTQALAEKKGVLLLFPHFISVYLAGFLLLENLNIPFSIMYHSPKNAVIKDFAHKRLSKSCEQIFRRKDVKAMLAHLRAGNLVWYAPDLAPGKKDAVIAPFFGHEIPTHTATARIARASGAKAILIGFCRDADNRFHIRFYPPLEDFPSEDETANATLLNHVLEEIIKQCPEQYLWQYNRFHTK